MMFCVTLRCVAVQRRCKFGTSGAATAAEAECSSDAQLKLVNECLILHREGGSSNM